ncbi:MAG TPA: response regulator transcription factor [Candidatus Avamphibacillus intestinigallinarum]|nr:response regulator transcription factor [Candidatus Avamphibacillus intestinigallinarum]
MHEKVLIVDDEKSIVTLLQFNLEEAGYQTEVAYDGLEALNKIRQEHFDFMILDLMLPSLDGMEVCKRLREENIDVPILMLTAKDEETDKILGFEVGADDYLTKPFSPKEVIVRVKAILRRISKHDEKTSNVIQIGALRIYPERYEATIKNDLLTFTPKEFELLLYLSQHLGRILTREQLLLAVWNYDFVGDTRIVDVHISHLRDKIEQNKKRPEYIKTVRGLGYKLEEPSYESDI